MKIPEQVRQFLSTIGEKGGKRKSKAKTAAARENAKLGGRPRLDNGKGTERQQYMRQKQRESRARRKREALKAGKPVK